VNRPRILVAAFLVLALAVGVFRAAREPRSSALTDPRPTSVNAQPGGARALSLWLREFGYSTRSWRKPLTALGDDVGALVLLEPDSPLSEAQAESLFAWVERGHVLVVAPGSDYELEWRLEQEVELVFDRTEASDVRGDRIVPDDGTRWRYRESTPDERGQFEYPVKEIAFASPDRVRDPSGEHSILFAREGDGLVAEIWYGDGAILLFPDPEMLTNRGLSRADNVELVASLVSDWLLPGTEIRFDDWSHGLRAGGSLEGYLLRRRPGLLLAALVSFSLLAVLRYGRALIVLPPTPTRRRDPAEFVEALGGLYARAKAVAPAWRATSRVVERVRDGVWRTPRLPAEERERRVKMMEIALAVGSRRRGAAGEPELLQLTRALADTLAPHEGRSKPARPAGGKHE
jgi:hypothetical protein